MEKALFNYEAFSILSKKVANTEDFEIIKDLVTCCTNYVKDVDVGETQIKRVYATLEGDELREAVMNIDRRRRNYHEAAIASCKMINRFAHASGVNDIFVGNVDDRYQVADFCLEITSTLYQNRRL